MVIPDLQRIGKYDVLERIADGGFATLYRGRDPFLKRLVAIKVCASDDNELRQQFLREAEIAGNLDHPSIVRTFDFGFDPVGPYLVQEYLQGEDLSYLISHRVPLPTRRKLELLVQIAEGLAYSHHRLVLHLDVKPGNVRVLGRRQAKILDFGIARLATSSAPAPGAMVGTAGYSAPEQVMSKAVDARSDVFAFGALAYELLTFSRPFAGGTIGELFKRVLASEAESMSRHWPDCDEALANLVGRCLRRDPAGRYPSFEVLLPELIAIRDSHPEAAPEPAASADAAEASPVARNGAADDPSRTVEVAIRSDAEADRVESAAIASSSTEPSPADTVPLGAVDPAIKKRRAGGSRRTVDGGAGRGRHRGGDRDRRVPARARADRRGGARRCRRDRAAAIERSGAGTPGGDRGTVGRGRASDRRGWRAARPAHRAHHAASTLGGARAASRRAHAPWRRGRHL